jgi:hypothetical protein
LLIVGVGDARHREQRQDGQQEALDLHCHQLGRVVSRGIGHHGVEAVPELATIVSSAPPRGGSDRPAAAVAERDGPVARAA